MAKNATKIIKTNINYTCLFTQTQKSSPSSQYSPICLHPNERVWVMCRVKVKQQKKLVNLPLQNKKKYYHKNTSSSPTKRKKTYFWCIRDWFTKKICYNAKTVNIVKIKHFNKHNDTTTTNNQQNPQLRHLASSAPKHHSVEIPIRFRQCSIQTFKINSKTQTITTIVRNTVHDYKIQWNLENSFNW